MARTADPSIKKKLLNRCLEATFDKGIAGFGLRKLAREAGTSARMLIYHFGSAESLFMEMIGEYSNREKSRFAARIDELDNMDTLGEFILFNWDAYQKEDRKKILISLIEIYARALGEREKHDAFFKEILFEWIELVECILRQKIGLKPADARHWSTLIIAVSRGLLLDWLASGDTDRADRAIAALAALADNQEGIET